MCLLGAVLALGGCVAFPAPAYRRVDTRAPEFKATVAREAALEEARGLLPAAAREVAEQRVEKQAVAAEKQRRTENVAPLNAALDAMGRPRGCWAYTVTTTRQSAGKTTVVSERFDPFQPEARLWTLLARDGRPPTEEEQAGYRRERLRKWRKQQASAADKKPASDRATRRAVSSEFEVVRDAADGSTTYAFERGPMKVALLASMAPVRETYRIDEANARVLAHTLQHLGPVSFFGNGLVVEAFESATDYAIVDPALAPFPARFTALVRLRALGTDHGEIATEAIYSDYHRVKCYDDRFEVQIGVPTVQDFLPGKP